jgi:membrane protease YdiL (CAAX protease family)
MKKIILLSFLAGAFFFYNLPNLWPIAPITVYPGVHAEQEASEFIHKLKPELDFTDWKNEKLFVRNENALNLSIRHHGHAQTEKWISHGIHFMSHRFQFKKANNPQYFQIWWHDTGVLGFEEKWEDDTPAKSVSSPHNEVISQVSQLGLQLIDSSWIRSKESSSQKENRTDYNIVYEKRISPWFKQTLSLKLCGDQLCMYRPGIEVSAQAKRELRKREAPRQLFFYLGLLGILIGGLCALIVLFRNNKRVSFSALAKTLVVVALGLFAVEFLQTGRMFYRWDPLWSWGIHLFKDTISNLLWNAPMLLFVFVFAAAAMKMGGKKGRSLQRALKGHFFHPEVGRASGWGFLVGLLCGGVLAFTVLFFKQFGAVPMQPQGFFSYAVNSASPAWSTLFFFLNIAFLEEFGYRWFGTLFVAQTFSGNSKLKILLVYLIPSLIFGFMHTTMEFLPPFDPFWARALMMTLVGMVWTWAFRRFDVLTVVLSHWVCDLFIFNWPRLASGEPALQLSAILTIIVPVIPWIIFQVKTIIWPKTKMLA